MEKVIEAIKERKTNLGESSMRAYTSTLRALHKKLFVEKEIELEDYWKEEVLEYVSGLEWKKRGVLLSSLIALTGKEEYVKILSGDKEFRREECLAQEKNEKQEENMIEFSEVKTKLEELKVKATKAYREMNKVGEEKKMELYQTIQDYVLLCLTSGVYIPPRRSMDWIVKIKEVNPEEDNWIETRKSRFVFNEYKTKKNYGVQYAVIPKPLKQILMKWVKVNPTEYLFFNTENRGLTQSTITKKLNKIFGKNISTSMLRHIFLTENFGEVHLKELTETAECMGTSPLRALEYVKR